MNAPITSLAQPVEFKLDGQTVAALPGETIIQTAQRLGTHIPRLCYMQGMRADGNCRACKVEIKGERVLAPSCCRYPSPGMEVVTDSARARASQKMVLELLLSDMPEQRYTLDSELDRWAAELGVGKPRFARLAHTQLGDRKRTRLNSSHVSESRMPSS